MLKLLLRKKLTILILLISVLLTLVTASYSPQHQKNGLIVDPKTQRYTNNEKNDNEDHDYRQKYNYNYNYDMSAVSVYDKSLDDFIVTSLLLASDIEGNLNAINRNTGELLWSLVGGEPLVSINSDMEDLNYIISTTPSTTNTIYSTTNVDHPHRFNEEKRQSYSSAFYKTSGENVKRKKNEMTWIVEPFGDGTVYHFTKKDGLQKLPVSIKQLVMNSPFSIDDNFVYTGVRTSGIIKVDAKTGDLIESFGLDNNNKNYNFGSCVLSDDDGIDNFDVSHCDDDSIEKLDQGPIITLGKTIYELTIHSKNNTSWNITYVLWGPNNLHTNLADENFESMDNLYIQPFHDSSLLALDAHSKSVKWVSNLPFVTVNVFDVLNDASPENSFIVLPHPLDKQTLSNVGKADLTYIDKTKEGSWYAMSEIHYPSLVRSAPVAKYITNERWRMPSIFASDDLLSISIAGVHDNSLKFKSDQPPEGNENLAVYDPIKIIPTSIEKELTHHHKKKFRYDHSGRVVPDSAKYHEEMLAIDSPGNDQEYGPNKPTSTFKVASFTKLIYRALENVVVAILCMLMFVGLSKFGLLPPISKVLNFNIEDTVISQQQEANKNEDFELAVQEEACDIEAVAEKEIEDILVEDQKENNVFKRKVKINETPEVFNEDEQSDETEEITKKRRKRGSRGGKRNKKKESSSSNEANNDNTENLDITITKISNNLSITDEVLGFGSHGTIVFRGLFENRPVAVKRMLLDFYDVASHEINLLQESDDHSNVIRYFCSQESNKFLYIALELCTASLEDVVEKKKVLSIKISQPKVLWQIANGVNHLHALKIVHRDIKPQNILVVVSKKRPTDKDPSVRFLISDFGLCKKLDADQSSFRGTTAHAAGTSGWRAPELLLESTASFSDQHIRLTRSVDIFSAGCVFYYVLTGGFHPFGDRYVREGNIIKGEYDLSLLDCLPDGSEAKDLIRSMINHNLKARPDITTVMKHPYFWSTEKKMEFLLKVSDRFEIERREPPSNLLLKLESISINIIGEKGWFEKFDANFIDNLGKYRKYNTHRLMDLLRAIRNKYHHFQDLPKPLLIKMSPLPDGFYLYFTRKFPNLLMVVYILVENILRDDELLSQFF